MAARRRKLKAGRGEMCSLEGREERTYRTAPGRKEGHRGRDLEGWKEGAGVEERE